MNTKFKYDVFLSHSSTDKEIVRDIANRLKSDNIKVWFDEDECKPGDNIDDKIEEGLEKSRILILCMSTHSFSSDWVKLESGTFRFRDPLNKERRFIPLRLDDAPIKGSLAQFLYIDWRNNNRDKEYKKLVDACHKDRELDKFKLDCGELLKNRTSERSLIESLLDKIQDLLQALEFDQQKFHWGILSTISAIIDKRNNYPLLNKFRSEADNFLCGSLVTVKEFSQFIDNFRSSLFDVLQILAFNGARQINAGDKILLYAHSQSVIAAINRWLQEHSNDKLELIFAQCAGKSIIDNQIFGQAIRSANNIKYRNARIFFAQDSSLGTLMKDGKITKVFLGAHQWGRYSYQRAWFTNTQGTCALITLAKEFSIPVYVLAENSKTQTEPKTSMDDDRASRPMETEQGIPIEYVGQTADDIDSKILPFYLITELGEFTCAEHGLRKRNRVCINRNNFSVTKTTTNQIASISEQIVLQALDEIRQSNKMRFKAPKPFQSDSPIANAVTMQRVEGIRMHDLIANLNEQEVRIRNDHGFSVEDLRTKTCKWALDDVITWQSCEIQNFLGKELEQNKLIYNFEEKLKESVQYVWGVRKKSGHLPASIIEEIENLSLKLKQRSRVFLRDANPKNQLFEMGKLLGSELPERCKAVGYYPKVDDQWHDPIVAEILIKKIPQDISWEVMSNHIWQVDFELSSFLTTIEDDFIHVLSSEIFLLDYDKIVEEITQLLNDVTQEQINETMLFRSFRAWARRLFYYHEAPTVFATRYRLESLGHHYRFALAAAEKLTESLGSELFHFIKNC